MFFLLLLLFVLFFSLFLVHVPLFSQGFIGASHSLLSASLVYRFHKEVQVGGKRKNTGNKLCMDLWEPSLPGAGAQRAVLVLQLYLRMGNYNSLSILVADALCLTFKAGGATVAELSAYLGLISDRVEAGIEGMPRELYCTSSDLPQEDMDNEEKNGKQRRKGGVGNTKSRHDVAEESTLRYYINYATMLPFVFAHGTHILLALCQMPLPQNMANSGPRGELASLNISPTLRRADCRRGLCCVSCRYWMALKDLQSTISRCPLCQTDILARVLSAIKSHYDDKLARGEQLLCFGPVQQQQQQQRSGDSGKPSATSQDALSRRSNTDAGEYALARDPFVVQQGLFFQFLYSHPLVCVNESSFVVDADEVMTKEEYEYRSRHRASALDQFRLVHRNTAAIRVKLVDEATLNEVKYTENALKLAKRTQLPPWLRPTSLFSDGDLLPPVLAAATEEQGSSSLVQTKKTRREGNIAASASYIAREFFDDDFDAVPFRRSLLE